MLTVRLALLLMVVLSSTRASVVAADLFPYFKPDSVEPVQIPIAEWEPTREYTAPPAHPMAAECAVNDSACLAIHDRNVLDLALVTTEGACCENSTHPQACREAFRMITGDVDPPPRWAGLDDPCTLVVRVDAGMATLYNPRSAQTRRIPRADLGWRAGNYVGACDVSSMGLRTSGSLESRPQFPWESERIGR